MRTIRYPILLSIALVFSARALAGGDARSGLDVGHYLLDLRFPPRLDSVTARATVSIALPTDAPDSLRLDFEGLVVDSVLVGDRRAAFRRTPKRLIVALPAGARRDSARVTVVYHGVPLDGLILSENKHGRRTVFADNWPNRAHFWFPGRDDPADKATVQFRITAPARYEAIANGRLLEMTNNLDGTRTTVWTEARPIPTYCMVVGLAEFSIRSPAQAGGVPFSFWVFPQERDAAIVDFARAPEIIDYFVRLIGPFPYEKLALVQSKTRFGGMENSSAIFLAESSIRGNRRVEGTVAHEIAHQWFGDAVTEQDWPELWLSEGFATYFGSLFFEHAEGKAVLRRRMQGMKRRIFEYHTRTGRPVIDTTITDLMRLLNPNNYNKGAWVLHMLRGLIGDEDFFAGIRTYYARFRDSNATTADFQRVMEEASHRRLGWFFDQWLRRPGYPVLDVVWRWLPRRRQLRIEVRQKQHEQVFRLPVEIETMLGHDTQRRSLLIDRRVSAATIPLSQRPDSVRVDPDGWLLAKISVRPEK